MNADTYDICQVRPRSLVIYPHYEGKKRKTSQLFSSVHDIKKERNQTKGYLSPNSVRKLRYAVNLLQESTPWTQELNPSTNSLYPFKLGFLTLTLPSPQGSISDETIKRKCLMPFITALQYRFGKFSYVWKAEAQNNGNIHFHITLNKWIHYSTLRTYWNRCLRKLGFIDAYRSNQLELHKNGFQYLPGLYDKRSEEQHRKAYEFGMLTNWNEPNTIDIHSVWKIQNLTAYIIKYMEKAERDKRPITGKIWGCSDNLTYNNKFEFVESGHRTTSGDTIAEIFEEIPLGIDCVRCFYRDSEIWEREISVSIRTSYANWLAAIHAFGDVSALN